MEPLVRHGADVDQVIEQQGSPLHVACSNQHLSTVKKLLELGENTSDLLCKRAGQRVSVSGFISHSSFALAGVTFPP